MSSFKYIQFISFLIYLKLDISLYKTKILVYEIRIDKVVIRIPNENFLYNRLNSQVQQIRV